jgi:hypothetical protein
LTTNDKETVLGLIKGTKNMAIITEENSIEYLSAFSPIRCDTHFKYNIKLADKVFSQMKISVWVSLGSVLDKVLVAHLQNRTSPR